MNYEYLLALYPRIMFMIDIIWLQLSLTSLTLYDISGELRGIGKELVGSNKSNKTMCIQCQESSIYSLFAFQNYTIIFIFILRRKVDKHYK